MAVCEVCERRHLEQLMRDRGVIQYDPTGDRRDADDRAWVAAQEYQR
jgi:hypothetical protein